MSINAIWYSHDENHWRAALDTYWSYVRPENMNLEKRMDSLDSESIKKLSAEGFYIFLHDEYFVWKYTAKNRLATTRKSLSGYMDNQLDLLEDIHRRLFSFDLDDAFIGLTIACSIKGLGTAGASGLLALLFPYHFGTVDQFVVKALLEIEGLPERAAIERINPLGISPKQGAMLIRIMKNKAMELNEANHTTFWTPRKIDMVLWASRSNM